MGCFLVCFGSSKNSNRNRKHRRKVQPPQSINFDDVDDQGRSQLPPSHGSFNSLQTAVTLVHEDRPVQSSVHSVQESSEKPVSPVIETRDKPVEQPISPVRKKVTFDSNVKTYEHIMLDESTDFSPKTEDGCNNEIDLSKPSDSQSSEDKSSIISSSTNHRYQNCRDSDDELDYEGSDIEDVDNEDDDDVELDYADVDDDYDDRILDSRMRNVHSVLSPVENLTQWNAAKAKGTTQQLKQQQKENFNSEQDPPRISFTSDSRINKLSSFSFESDFEHQPKKSTSQEISVDASLSNWLSSTETMPSTKTSKFAFNTPTPERSISYGSISPRSFEDRPILGALTVEELKQISSSSPRKSPNRNPDEMPIIGTVGTYWNHAGAAKDCSSVNSFKGIPNTTSKYREDKRVNWHSTPFETQLERALNSS